MEPKMIQCPKCQSDDVFFNKGDGVGWDVYLKVGQAVEVSYQIVIRRCRNSFPVSYLLTIGRKVIGSG
jgi:hypothetical protein